MGSMTPKKRVNTMDTAVSRPRLAAVLALNFIFHAS
jgi:hypothetical protein